MRREEICRARALQVQSNKSCAATIRKRCEARKQQKPGLSPERQTGFERKTFRCKPGPSLSDFGIDKSPGQGLNFGK